MIIRRKTRNEREQWHPVFAWLPVSGDGFWAWLEPVERKILVDAYGVIYLYRLPQRFYKEQP